MKSFLHYWILLLILFGLQAQNVKAVQKSWAGGAAGDVSNWNNAANWSPVGVPVATDDVFIGSLLFFTNSPVVNAGDNVSCASITFGVILSLTTVPLTVNGTLNVSGSVAMQPTLLISYSVPLSGSGTLNCGSIQINDNSNPGNALLGIFPSLNFIVTLQNLNISGNVTVNSTTVVALVIPLGEIDGKFSLVSGTTTIGGQILTQNTLFRILGLSNSIGNPVFSIAPPTGSTATLILTNANPINTTPISGSTYAGSIDFYNSTGTGQATVIYAYAGAGVQTVYATTGISNLDVTPALYQNLVFTSTGNKRPSVTNGLLTVAGNIDNSASSPIDFVTNTNTVQLTGTTQTIAGGSYVNSALPASPVGTVFYNLTSSAATTTLSGRNNIAALGTLAFLKTSNTTMNVDATATNSLTLLSNSTGDASIASLSTDASSNAITATVTGSINVQRYVKGGGGSTGPRRYMLISSPVANVSASTYNLVPFFATTYITGSPGGGFDSSPQNNPSVFIYDENAPATTNPNVVTGNEFKGFNTINETVPMGNGVEFYFRGSRTGVSSSTVFVSPFPAPDNATLNFSGAVYKGAGTNGAFTASIINFPATPPTYYSSSAVTFSNNLSYASSASTKKGLNLVGNPYPSVIDLQKVYSGNGNAYRYYYMLVKNISTGANSFSTKYAVYDATNSGTPPAGASRYAVSGQGFFITAANTTSTLTFNEGMKVPYSSYTSPASTSPVFNVIRNPSVIAKTLAVSPDKANNTQQVAAAAAPAAAQTNVDPMPRLRLEMMKDTNILNTADIAFDKNSSAKFVPGEDAPYIAASGQGDFFYSQSADSVGCFANYTGNLEKLKRINLFIAFSNFGQYKITSPIKSNIDERYTIYLKDKYTNDSLDVVHNDVYTFNVDQNAASYPRDRFYLSIGIAPGHEYKLLGFNGNKVTGGIQLTWKTDNESNFTGFAVQKSTNGGKSFEVIDSLQSTGAGSYTFTDPAPGTGQITYRLAQSLVTGDTQLSKNLVFDYSGDLNVLKFMVYPSNTAQDIHIKLGKTYSNNIKINIISATGSMVKTLTTTDTDSVQENVGNLIKGLYIVEAIDATTGKRIGSAKFFKQ